MPNEFGSGGFWDMVREGPPMAMLSRGARQRAYDAALSAARRYAKAIEKIKAGFSDAKEEPARDFVMTDEAGFSSLFLLRIVCPSARSSGNLFQLLRGDMRSEWMVNTSEAYRDGVAQAVRDKAELFERIAGREGKRLVDEPVLSGLGAIEYISATYFLLLRAQYIDGGGNISKGRVRWIRPIWPFDFEGPRTWRSGGGDA